MKVSVLSISFSAVAAYPPITNYSCPYVWNFGVPVCSKDYRVPELNDQCITECQQDYISCVAECWSYNCYRECVVHFSNCNNFCPCGTECPLGCVDCGHHLCEQVCKIYCNWIKWNLRLQQLRSRQQQRKRPPFRRQTPQSWSSNTKLAKRIFSLEMASQWPRPVSVFRLNSTRCGPLLQFWKMFYTFLAVIMILKR